MSAGPGDPSWRHGLVVFCDATDLWWLRLLRPGFRHCFVALAVEGGWVVVDPLSHRTGVAHFPLPEEFDLAAWYGQHGLKVVHVKNISPEKRVAPLAPYSCVESVKRDPGNPRPMGGDALAAVPLSERNEKISVDGGAKLGI
ncbi:MAG: hypothetical protein NVV74_25695 [Magnetospirillum sp.]|nr:hypothetical protein [Magnetospirillum sp.]